MTRYDQYSLDLLQCILVLSPFPQSLALTPASSDVPATVAADKVAKAAISCVLQIEIMKLLQQYQRRVTAVGDDKQSIYGFRGADHTAFHAYKAIFGNPEIRLLTTNYRCGEAWTCFVVWCGVEWCGAVWCGEDWAGLVWGAGMCCGALCFGVLCCVLLDGEGCMHGLVAQSCWLLKCFV